MPSIQPVSECTLYIPGHLVHWIQAIHSASEPRRPQRGRVAGVDEGLVTVSFGDEQRRYRNHDTDRLREILAAYSADVIVDEGWSILKLPHGDGRAYCLSIAKESTLWRPCSYYHLVSLVSSRLSSGCVHMAASRCPHALCSTTERSRTCSQREDSHHAHYRPGLDRAGLGS
jgi:hypothetical protein